MIKIRPIVLAGFVLLFSLSVHAQNKQVTGKVTAKDDGSPLPGVSVVVKGTNKGIQTDASGNYKIEVSATDVLRFSAIGFKPQEVKPEKGRLDVVLLTESNALQEVVVTALGISKEKKSLGYAVQELKGSNITQAKEPNLVNSLSGKIAGVNITNSQGNMGSSRIIIRGETSIAGNNQPLFVVNGIPVDNSQLGAGGSRDYANAIADINPEDIETISVLKGPNAAALYGSRAASGVVLIQTKTGKNQKGLGVSLHSNTTFENLLVLPKYQDIYGQGSGGKFSYVDGKGGGVNDGVDESWGPKMDGRLIPQFFSNGVPVPFVPHPNNVRGFFETGHTLNNGVSIAGSSDKSDFRFSYNNSSQKGVTPNSDLGKNSLSINTSYRIIPDLNLTVDANYVRTAADNLPGAGGLRATSTMLQFLWFGRQVDVERLRNYTDENGNNINWNNSYYSNPYFIAYENTVGQRRDRLFGSVNLNYKIIDGLTANFRTGNDYYNDRRKLKVAYGTNGTPFGSYQELAYAVNENNTEATLNYKKELNTDFSLDVLGGGNLRSRFYEENNQQAPRLAVPGVYTLANSRDPLISANSFNRLKIYSVFSSAQIGFRNYAYLNLTARNDWSSTLPSANNSYFYPSANASVILSEAFGWKSNTLTYAKLRGGWSKVGKDTDPYQLINTYPFNNPFGSSPLLTVNDKYLSTDLKPENTESTEAGFELGFWNNRVKLDFSVYNTNSYNQIFSPDISPTTGYLQKLLNAGKINNRGLEVQLGLTPVRTEDNFQWDVNLNYSMNRSKVEELDREGQLSSYIIGAGGSGAAAVQVLAAIGSPYGSLFGTAYLRNASGQILVNADGTPSIDPTKRILGSYPPKWIGGINNSFSYKGISLSFLVDAKVGGTIYSATHKTGLYTGVLEETLQGRDENHGGLSYYYPGDNTANKAVQLPGASSAAPSGETVYNDGLIFNGVKTDGSANNTILPAQQYYKSLNNINEAHTFSATAVRLREVVVGFNLPSAWVKTIGLNTARVSLTGRNLWIIHKNVPNIDPETAFSTGNAQGLEDLSLPTTRSYGFNFNLTF